jgi:hypothetical protein
METAPPIDLTNEADAPTTRMPGLATAALCSIGAGAIHAAAMGRFSAYPTLAKMFVLAAALQIGAGLWALLRPGIANAGFIVFVNTAAVFAWLATRTIDIFFIDGLRDRLPAHFGDSVCAAMGAAAIGGAMAARLVGPRPAPPAKIAIPALLVAALAIPAMWTSGTSTPAHALAATTADGSTATSVATEDTAHTHDSTPSGAAATNDTTPSGASAAPGANDWPRPWDPAKGVDLSGVPNVTPEEQARAQKLIDDTLRDLPKWADTKTAIADGYKSIGDAGTGNEHYIKTSLIEDKVMLDPTQPESLVYTVKGSQRILAGAMFIASARPSDDPSLTSFAGDLMTWHNHGNLCWAIVNGNPTVVAITDATGKCARGVNTGGANPMVHVWIAPNQCGPFAALEGVGAGQATVPESQRHDLCNGGHSHTTSSGSGSATGNSVAAVAKPYDPNLPIDLSGTPGVTPQQQAKAENLVAVTLVRLPAKWADYKAAEAAGFHSIGDALTGFEHYINWDWINDDVTLDPDHPESLVYQPQPDGSKKLVSAMYMLPDSVTLDKVPDIGGALMQWHIHDNLCFTDDPVAPKVAGVIGAGGTCSAPLKKFRPAPMIHVWIVPHTCGPFAALEGVGAGQILAGQQRLCDHQHGNTAGL